MAADTMTATLTFLQTPELVTLTAYHLPKAALLALSQASIIAHQAAIPAIWRVLPSPMPLFALFKTFELHSNAWQFTEPPSVLEIQRFDNYARHVRGLVSVFTSHTDNKPILLQSFLVVQTLTSLFPGIFPGLISATIKDQPHVPHGYPLCTPHFLSSGTVTRLTIDISAYKSNLAVIIPHVLKECSGTLTHLRLCGPRFLTETVVEGVTLLRQLQHLAVDMSLWLQHDKAGENWRKLCHGLPALKVLYLNCIPDHECIMDALANKRIDTIVLVGKARALRANTNLPWNNIRYSTLVIGLGLRFQSQPLTMTALEIAQVLHPWHYGSQDKRIDLHFYHIASEQELFCPLRVKRDLLGKHGMKGLSIVSLCEMSDFHKPFFA